MDTYEYLELVKAKLQEIEDIKTIAIGLEKGIGAKDAPFIRILPIQRKKGNMVSKLIFQVAFGFDRKNKDIEILYKDFFDLEAKILNKINNIALWHSTVTDEDTVANLKVAVMNFESAHDIGVVCVN